MLIFASITPWLAFGLAVALLAAVVLGPHNWRVHRVRKAYRALPQQVRGYVLDAVRNAAPAGRSVTFLRLTDREATDQRELAIASHVGGSPYAEAGDQWPMHDGEPARFLM